MEQLSPTQIAIGGVALVAVLAVLYAGIRWWTVHRSPIEALLIKAMRKAGLPEPVAQLKINDHRGHLVTIPDFAYTAERIAIFCDGWKYHGDENTAIRDARKRNYLSRTGWVVLVFHGRILYREMDYCLGEIQEALRARATGF